MLSVAMVVGCVNVRAERGVDMYGSGLREGDVVSLAWEGPLLNSVVVTDDARVVGASNCRVWWSVPVHVAVQFELLRRVGTTRLATPVARQPRQVHDSGRTEHPTLKKVVETGCTGQASSIAPEELNRFDRETRRLMLDGMSRMPECRERPFTEDCYRRSLQSVHGWDTSPARLERWARGELARLHAVLVAQVGAANLPAALASLREPHHAFEDEGAMLRKAWQDVERAEAVTPWATTMCGLVMGSNNIGSYYRGDWVVDGDWRAASRSVSRPLAHHECYPGHHLQHEMLAADIPESRDGWIAGYSEGWAMFAEQQVAREWGLYEDEDEIGLTTYQIWRVTRVLADVGYWHGGWDTEDVQNLYWMATPLPRSHIEIEAGRIAGDPAWLTAHGLGYQHFKAIRGSLPDNVNPDDFYHLVLSEGPTTMPVLRMRVQAWLEEEEEAVTTIGG